MLFLDWLKNNSKIVLFDGGFGSELIKRGLKSGKIPDILNIEQPDIISGIHESYYNAGSDMCQTNTFGSTPLNLSHHNLESRIEEIIENALENITKIRPSKRLIVGDIGPTGEFRPPVGNASSDQWYSSFLTQVKLLEAGVDLWHIETISDLEEILAAIKAVREVSKKPVIASITYKKTKRGFFTIMGDSLEKCVKALNNEDIDVIGANCTLGSHEMVDLLNTTIDFSNKPLSVKPNAGQPVIKGNQTYYEQPIDDFANDIKEMIGLGAKIVGGCCGTSPKTIRAIREIINSL